MKLYVAADHAGFALKEALVPFLRDELGCDVEDCGAFEHVPADDYPDIIANAAARVAVEGAAGSDTYGIVIGKSGQGEAMTANRFVGVRAAVYYGGNQDILTLSREHNNANILALGAGFMNEAEAKEAVRLWLTTPFSNEDRHVFRIRKIDEIAHDATHSNDA